MSKLTYNGISLPFIKTTSVAQESKLDPSGQDQLWTDITITVTSLFTPLPNTVGKFLPFNVGESTVDLMARIRHQLLLPRKELKFEVGGKTLVFANKDNDVQHGPFPIRCDITDISGTVFMINYSIRCSLIECPEHKQEYLSLRWTQNQAINLANFSTVRTTGKLIVGSGKEKGFTSADSLRYLVAPVMLPGFVRERADYQLSESGLELNFDFEDIEQNRLPPSFAVKDAGFAARIFQSPQTIGIVSYRAEAEKSVDRGDLALMVFEVAFRRLIAMNPIGLLGNAGKFIIQGATMKEFFDTDKNSMECTLQAILDPNPLNQSGQPIGTRFFNFVVNPEEWSNSIEYLASTQNGGQPLKPGQFMSCGAQLRDKLVQGIASDIRGNYPNFLLFAAALRDPCLAIAANELKPKGNDESENPLGDGSSNAVSPPSQKGPVLNYGQATSQFVQAYSASINLDTNSPIAPGASLSVVKGKLDNNTSQVSIYKDASAGIYNDYDIDLYFHIEGGVGQLPSTKTGVPAAKTEFQNESITLTVYWDAEKAGGPPTIPSRVPIDSNCFFMNGTIGASSIELAPDQVTLIYKLSGVYNFGFFDASAVRIGNPVPPWLNMSASQIVLVSQTQAFMDTSN